MEKAIKILIFTDLDGSLLHRDTFKFDEIKDYLKQLISKGIFIIPNTSKTEKEILQFNYELGSNLPFISENGAAINGLDLLNPDLPKATFVKRFFTKSACHHLKPKYFNPKSKVSNLMLYSFNRPLK